MTGVAAGLSFCDKIVFTYSIANFPTLPCLLYSGHTTQPKVGVSKPSHSALDFGPYLPYPTRVSPILAYPDPSPPLYTMYHSISSLNVTSCKIMPIEVI